MRFAMVLSSFPNCFLAVAVILIVQAKVLHHILQVEDRFLTRVNTLYERCDSIGLFNTWK